MGVVDFIYLFFFFLSGVVYYFLFLFLLVFSTLLKGFGYFLAGEFCFWWRLMIRYN